VVDGRWSPVTVMLPGCHGFAISFTSNGLERLTATRQLVMDREKGSKCEEPDNPASRS
jgi:hypothetical protein